MKKISYATEHALIAFRKKFGEDQFLTTDAIGVTKRAIYYLGKLREAGFIHFTPGDDYLDAKHRILPMPIDVAGKDADEIARDYAEFIVLDKPTEFFAKVNKVILTKYKESGLLRIKEKAWKIAGELIGS